jgi:hypothetical protein
MLAQPLEWVPGTTYAYSNFGYMLLALIVEQLSGMNHWDFVTSYVLTPNMWSPATEVFRGRSFKVSQSPREPNYEHPGTCQNVFDPSGPSVSCPYGAWSHENFLGHGNLVASAAPLLRYLDKFTVFGGSIGLPHGGNPVDMWHNGAVDGTSTTARQTSQGFHVVVLYNKRGSGPHLADQAMNLIVAAAQNITTWPTGREVDGFWVDFAAPAAGFGGHDDAFNSMPGALAATTNGSKLRFEPGSTKWSGVLTEKLLLDAPNGTCRIGE